MREFVIEYYFNLYKMNIITSRFLYENTKGLTNEEKKELHARLINWQIKELGEQVSPYKDHMTHYERVKAWNQERARREYRKNGK